MSPIQSPRAFDLDGEDDPGATRTEWAYKSVSEMIATSRLRSGDMIIESRLARYLATSRTPVRAALQKLEGEGLLERAGGQSFVVRRVDLEDYLCCLRTRELLESEAAERAAGKIPLAHLEAVRQEMLKGWVPGAAIETLRRLDDDVHDLVVIWSGNMVLARLVRLLRMRVWLYAMAIHEAPRARLRLEASRVEHLALLDALADENGKRARAAMLAHLKSLAEHELSGLS